MWECTLSFPQIMCKHIIEFLFFFNIHLHTEQIALKNKKAVSSVL